MDHLAVLDIIETIARQAGAVLREYYERPRAAHTKSTSIDLVTEADGQSEKLIVAALREHFPDHRLHGEEGGGYGPPAEATPYHWYIDPLDGTTNFAHRLPVFAVVIALSDPDLVPVLGVVYDPMRDEMFKALRGQGSWLNGRRMRVSQVPDLAQAAVVTGFPYDRWTGSENNLAHFNNFVLRSQAVRWMGSAALDLCYVAAGRLDGYWEHGPKPWDVQTGLLCVQEAGGTVTDYAGVELTREARSGSHILASNGRIHAQMSAVLMQGEAAPRPSSI